MSMSFCPMRAAKRSTSTDEPPGTRDPIGVEEIDRRRSPGIAEPPIAALHRIPRKWPGRGRGQIREGRSIRCRERHDASLVPRIVAPNAKIADYDGGTRGQEIRGDSATLPSPQNGNIPIGSRARAPSITDGAQFGRRTGRGAIDSVGHVPRLGWIRGSVV